MEVAKSGSSKGRGAVVIRRPPQLSEGKAHPIEPVDSSFSQCFNSSNNRLHSTNNSIESQTPLFKPTRPSHPKALFLKNRTKGGSVENFSVVIQESDPPPFLDSKPVAQSWLKVSDVLWGSSVQEKTSCSNVQNESTSNMLSSGSLSTGKGKESQSPGGKEENTPKWLQSCTEAPLLDINPLVPAPPESPQPLAGLTPGAGGSPSFGCAHNHSFGMVTVESLSSSCSVSPRETSPGKNSGGTTNLSVVSQERRNMSYAARHGPPPSGFFTSGGPFQARYGPTTAPSPGSEVSSTVTSPAQSVVPQPSSALFGGGMLRCDSPGLNDSKSTPRAPLNVLQRTTSYQDELRTPRNAIDGSVCVARSITPGALDSTEVSTSRGIREIFPQLPETMFLARERVFAPHCDVNRKLGKGQFGEVILGELYPPIEVTDNLSFFSPISSEMQVLIPADPATDSNVSSRMATPQRTRGGAPGEEPKELLPVHQQRYTGSSKAFYHSGVSQNGSLLLSQSFSTSNLDTALNWSSISKRSQVGQVMSEDHTKHMHGSSMELSFHSFEEIEGAGIASQYNPLRGTSPKDGSRQRVRASSWDSITSVRYDVPNPLLNDIASVSVERHNFLNSSPPAPPENVSSIEFKNRLPRQSYRSSSLQRELPQGSPNSVILEDLDENQAAPVLLRPSPTAVPQFHDFSSLSNKRENKREDSITPTSPQSAHTPRRRVEKPQYENTNFNSSNVYHSASSTGFYGTGAFPLSNPNAPHKLSFKGMLNVVLTGSSNGISGNDSEGEGVQHKISTTMGITDVSPAPLDLFEPLILGNSKGKNDDIFPSCEGSPKVEDLRRPRSQQSLRCRDDFFFATRAKTECEETKNFLEEQPSEHNVGDEDGKTVEFALPFRAVAVKNVCKADLNQPKRSRELLNEIKMASHLRHKALVNWFGVSESNGDILLVMDLAEKGNLEQYINKFGVGHTRDMAPRFMADLVLALEYLRDGRLHPYNPTHQFGKGCFSQGSPDGSSAETGSPDGSPRMAEINGGAVLHRDLKPENLLLTWDYHIKIADFGSSCFFGDGEAIKRYAGTAPYICPEIVMETRTSRNSDMWSAGCILYQMLEGKGPFTCKTDYLSLQKIKKYTPDTLTFSPEVSPEARDLVLQLLQRKPEDRLGSEERGGFATLKKHPFFKDIDWDNVLDTSNLTTKNQEYDVSRLSQHLSPDEAVLYNALVVPLDDQRFKTPVLLVLTDAPRLFIVDPHTNEHILDLHWSRRIQVTVECSETFRLEEKGRTVYRFRDECRRADLWAERIAILGGTQTVGTKSKHRRNRKKFRRKI